MSNMNYCVFENTAQDLEQAVEKMDKIISGEIDVEELTSYELRGLDNILGLAEEIVSKLADIEEILSGGKL